MAGLIDRRLTAGICAVLGLLTLWAYWPATHYPFINFDDPMYVSANARVQAGLSWSGVRWAFTNQYACNWHPLTWLSHMMDCEWYDLHSGAHHLTNVLFHAADSILLYLLLLFTTGAQWRSACVAALFAWHPTHVESVAWIAERKDVLSTLFWILTLIAYARYVKSPTPARYGLALIWFAAGLMSKPMVVTLPFVLLLMDYWPFGRMAGATPSGAVQKSLARLAVEKIPFFALAVLVSSLTFWIQRDAGAMSTFTSIPFRSRLVNALVSYARYVSKIFYPVNLSPIYPFPKQLPSLWLIGGSAILLLGATALFLWRAKKNPWLIFGWLWFLGTLVPVIGLVQVGTQSMADRYLYIPSIGLFITIVWGAWDLIGSSGRFQAIPIISAVLCLAVCLAVTRLQLGFWRSGEVLFRHALAVTTDNYVALGCLGKALDDEGRLDEALTIYRKAVALEPHYPESQYNLGTSLMKKGKLEEAVVHLSIAAQDIPTFAAAYNNLGDALLKLGRLKEAIPHLAKAVSLQPDDPEIHFNFGTALMLDGKPDDAIAQFEQALALNSNYSAAHANLAVALVRMGRLTDSIPHFSEAVRLDPANTAVRLNLGTALLDANRPREAASEFSEVLRLDPHSAAAEYQFGIACSRQHLPSEAIAHLRQALKWRDDYPEALDALAWILATAPNAELRSGTEAVTLSTRACELTHYTEPKMVLTLAAARAESGQFPEAIADARKAQDLSRGAGRSDLSATATRMIERFESGQNWRSEP